MPKAHNLVLCVDIALKILKNTHAPRPNLLCVDIENTLEKYAPHPQPCTVCGY